MNPPQEITFDEPYVYLGMNEGDRVELPLLDWPADLFQCDATEAELMMEDFDFSPTITDRSRHVLAVVVNA